jgi:hypothetical protein
MRGFWNRDRSVRGRSSLTLTGKLSAGSVWTTAILVARLIREVRPETDTAVPCCRQLHASRRRPSRLSALVSNHAAIRSLTLDVGRYLIRPTWLLTGPGKKEKAFAKLKLFFFVLCSVWPPVSKAQGARNTNTPLSVVVPSVATCRPLHLTVEGRVRSLDS